MNRSQNAHPTAWLFGSFLLSSSALAELPIAFDGWNVDEGHIDLSCPTNANCTEAILDNGFATRNVTIDGETYVQTILTDRGVTGDPNSNPFSVERGNMDFFNEVFVRMNTSAASNIYITGLASKMEMVESSSRTQSIEDRMFMSSILDMGWATETIQNDTYNLSYTPTFDLLSEFEISTVDYSGATPEETFHSIASQREVNGGENHDRRFDQFISDGEGGAMKFAHRDISGYLQDSEHFADSQNPLLPGGSNGGDFEWGPNAENHWWFGSDRLRATWVGQDMPAAGGSSIGYTKLSGHSSGLTPIATLGETQLVRADPNPAGWHEVFGPVPDMASRRTVEATAPRIEPATPTGTVAQETPLVGTGPSGPPIAFDDFVVSSGNILANCPANATCSTGLTADGFLQREITVDGITYYQTIVTESGSTGDPTVTTQFSPTSLDEWIVIPADRLEFTNETFVRAGNGNDQTGVSNRTDLAVHEYDEIYPSIVSDNVDYTTTLNTGWARGGEADPILETTQKIHSFTGLVGFEYLYDMKVGEGEARDITLHNSVGTLIHGNPIDFTTKILRGGYQYDTHVADFQNPILPNGSNGGDINWQAGESIQATWVGGSYLSNGRREIIGVTAFRNLTTGEETSETSLEDPQPIAWPDPFGEAPVYFNSMFD